jgi:hypothetical protein
VSEEWQCAEYFWGERRKVERSLMEGRERAVLDGRRGIVVTDNNCSILELNLE